MKTPEIISNKEARNIILRSQLLSSDRKFKSKYDIHKIIEKLSYLQIDTISIVERSHHHILWSRMNSYKREMLDELIEKDKLIFEYWSHAAAYLPMSDYKFSLSRKRNFALKNKTWGSANKRIIKLVLDRIRSEGPMMSRNFEDKKAGDSGWWNWKPSKDALDYLFHSGKLMIAKRQGFQKVYDLTERVLPAFADISLPSDKEFYKFLIDRSLNSYGISRQSEIMYLRKYDRKLFGEILKEMEEEKDIVRVKVSGLEDELFFATKKSLEILNSKSSSKKFNILSPFDNLIIQRKRLKDIFNFDYQLECYVPQLKRKFGYFCLPVLYGDKFIGKIDAKSFRDKKTFLIIKQFTEEGVKLSQKMKSDYLKKISQLGKFTDCTEIRGM